MVSVIIVSHSISSGPKSGIGDPLSTGLQTKLFSSITGFSGVPMPFTNHSMGLFSTMASVKGLDKFMRDNYSKLNYSSPVLSKFSG